MGGSISTGPNVSFSATSSTMLQSATSIIFGPGLTITQGHILMQVLVIVLLPLIDVMIHAFCIADY